VTETDRQTASRSRKPNSIHQYTGSGQKLVALDVSSGRWRNSFACAKEAPQITVAPKAIRMEFLPSSGAWCMVLGAPLLTSAVTHYPCRLGRISGASVHLASGNAPCLGENTARGCSARLANEFD
jgi:hypothetical protein